MPTLSVLDASGQSVAIETPNGNGRRPASGSRPVALANEDKASIDALLTDTQLRANPVAVTGPLTDAQLRADPVRIAPVSAALPISASALPLPEGGSTSALQTTGNTAIASLRGTEYEAVAAGQTNQVLGATGAVADFLESLLIVPTTLSPGAVTIQDGPSGTPITVFAGGTDSISTLHPFAIPVAIRALSTGWRVTTGAGLSVLASGNFT